MVKWFFLIFVDLQRICKFVGVFGILRGAAICIALLVYFKFWFFSSLKNNN